MVVKVVVVVMELPGEVPMVLEAAAVVQLEMVVLWF
jgi:hypothetical protein